MGNFRQHVGFAGTVGVVYAWAAHALGGVHWLYGTMTALLATIGGVLPDIDHPLGVEIKSLTTLLGTAGALIAWRKLHISGVQLPIELQIWTVILTYMLLRVGTRSLVSRFMVHRGMCHSLPTCVVWGAIIYLLYPSHYHAIRVWMAGAVMAGFLSHLVLDEMFSVDLKGTRVKRSFGTAIKLWAPSLVSTLGVYILLYFLMRGVLHEWPRGPILAGMNEPVPAPDLPPLPKDLQLPRQWLDVLTPETGRASSTIPAAIPAPRR